MGMIRSNGKRSRGPLNTTVKFTLAFTDKESEPMFSLTRAMGDSLSPLRIRPLRLYLGGQAISVVGTWMQAAAQSWVVWELSHSTTMLGVVALLSTLPFLVLGPWAGVWADRLNRRQFLIALQLVALTLAVILALLVQTGLVQLWQVGVLSLLLGMENVFDMTVPQAFVVDVGGREQLRKGVVINSGLAQSGRSLGPVVAGLVISTLGVALAFWLNALSFIAVIVTLLCVHAKQERRPNSGNTLQEFWEGIRFAMEQPRIQDLIYLLILTTFFGFASIQLLPAFATDILHGQAETLGLLLGASAAGALTGSLLIAPLVLRMRRIGVVVSTAVIWVGSWFALFASSTFLPLSLLCLFFTGLGTTVVVTMVVGLVQTLAPQAMRGRLQSMLLIVSFGFQPIAALVLGYSATWLSAPRTVLLAGLLMMAGATLLLVFRFNLRT